MFTCDFLKQCIKDEKLAREEYLGDSKGIKLIFRTILWIIIHEHNWKRNINCCHSGCHKWNRYHVEHFSKSCTPKILEKINEIDKNTTYDKYYI